MGASGAGAGGGGGGGTASCAAAPPAVQISNAKNAATTTSSDDITRWSGHGGRSRTADRDLLGRVAERERIATDAIRERALGVDAVSAQGQRRAVDRVGIGGFVSEQLRPVGAAPIRSRRFLRGRPHDAVPGRRPHLPRAHARVLRPWRYAHAPRRDRGDHDPRYANDPHALTTS